MNSINNKKIREFITISAYSYLIFLIEYRNKSNNNKNPYKKRKNIQTYT